MISRRDLTWTKAQSLNNGCSVGLTTHRRRPTTGKSAPVPVGIQELSLGWGLPYSGWHFCNEDEAVCRCNLVV